jgi:hypothetical protein
MNPSVSGKRGVYIVAYEVMGAPDRKEAVVRVDLASENCQRIK